MHENDMALARKVLVNRLKADGYIRTTEVADAMESVKRHLFLPAKLQRVAYVDRPQSIGHGQTISAPHMVALMAEHLQAMPGMNCLEIGGGCGYHAAVIAELLGSEGHVTSVEVIPELVEIARSNLENAGYSNRVTVVHADGSVGHPEGAPYQRIWMACASPGIPPELIEQLDDPGLLLVPSGSLSVQELMLMEKRDGNLRKEMLGGCVFVPLVGKRGFSAFT